MNKEDLKGEPFVGRAGQLLTRLIEGIEPHARRRLHRQRREVPATGEPRSAARRDRSVRALARGQLEFIEPRVIVTLGNFATKLLLDTKDGITKLRGKEFAFSRAGHDAVLIPTFHPSAVLRIRRQGPRRIAGRLRAHQASAVPNRMTPEPITTTECRRDRSGRGLVPGALLVDPATSSCWSAISAPARPRSRRVLPRGLGVTEPVTSPTFTIVQEYDGRRSACARRRLPARPPPGVARPRLRRARWRDAVALVEWGDIVAPAACPVDRARRAPRDDRRPRARATIAPSCLVVPAWRERLAATSGVPRDADCSASTPRRVASASCVADEHGVRRAGRAREHSPTPGRRARRELAPAIEWCCAQCDVELAPAVGDRGWRSVPACSPGCGSG